MKIGVADNCGLKFSRDIVEHWNKKGHEVRYERGASEHIAQWADLYYIDWSDNNIHYLFKIYTGIHPEHPGGKTYKRPKFVVRAIDWDVWCGLARNQDLVDFVDQWICIAPHIERKLRAEANFGDKLKMIRPGVNLERFTLKQKQTDGFQIGMVLGDMWWVKNHMAGLDIFTSLYRKNNKWRFHIRGQHEGGEYWPIMYEHYLDSRGIRNAVTLYSPVDDMRVWYENIDILLHPGMKEAFCYAIAEAMAKGIPVMANDFYGAREIWPAWILYQTHQEAVEKITKGEVTTARSYIEDKYNVKTMLEAYDQLLGT